MRTVRVKWKADPAVLSYLDSMVEKLNEKLAPHNHGPACWPLSRNEALNLILSGDVMGHLLEALVEREELGEHESKQRRDRYKQKAEEWQSHLREAFAQLTDEGVEFAPSVRDRLTKR